MPAISLAAIAATGAPMVLATNGTVRLARGFTSSTKMRGSAACGSSIANCTFIRPRTFSARAIASVWRFSSSIVSARSENGGSEQALSPECTPASSMCSITPATNTASPSQSASTSTSVARDRYWSISTGEVAGDLHRVADVAAELLLVADDLHRPPAQHVGGPDHHRVADPARALERLLRTCGRWR